MAYTDIDENAGVAPHLDDEKFVKTREAILLLLPKLFPDGSSKFTNLTIMEHLIDETVADIGDIWLGQSKPNKEKRRKKDIRVED